MRGSARHRAVPPADGGAGPDRRPADVPPAGGRPDGVRLSGIRHFALRNGPGVRTVIFFKGCPLRCAWCCNPETQSPRPDLAYARQSCLAACGLCAAACPRRALYRSRDGGIGIAREACDLCGRCVPACPAGALALVGERRALPGLLAEVEKDAFPPEDGGVTLSGGEPFMQPAACAALVQALSGRGLHCAVETCGFFDLDDEAVRQALHAAHLLFFDLKHGDPIRHKEGTGVENDRILGNLRRIGREFPRLPVITRTPVVPGFNDSTAEMLSIARLAAAVPTLLRHELLAYNPLCESKYAQLGRPGRFAHSGRVPEAAMRRFADVFRQNGIAVALADRPE